MSFIDKIFKWIYGEETKPKKPLKTLKELDFLDDVWIKDSCENILKGWVFDINKKHIYVTVPVKDEFLDFRFIITRPLNQIELTQNNNTLYLNNPWK